MVTDKTIHTVLRRLEIYFLKNNHYRLLGNSYELMLLIPSVSNYSQPKYSWLISATFLDNKTQKEAIEGLINNFKKTLDFEEFDSISRINIINSNHPLVKNLKFVFPYKEDMREISDLSIGGIKIERGYLLHSKILEKLRMNTAVVFIKNDGSSVPAGIISMNEELEIKYYTGKALRILFKPETDSDKKLGVAVKKESEEYKIENEYIKFINLNDIYSVM